MSRPEIHSRSAARMAAVQALYQMETAGTGVERIIDDFTRYWMRQDDNPNDSDPTPNLQGADKTYFSTLVRGIVEAQDRIDPYLERQLADGWKLSRLDATVRAILRAGLFELIRLPETPVRVILDEYIEIARSFFEGEEVGFVNAVLDAAAQQARSDELVP